MFGLLSAGVSLAGLGMSAVQAIKANRDMKKAQADANAALTQYGNITRPNAFAALQAPDVSSLAYDRNQRMMAQGTEALQGMGPEGAAGVANLLQAGQESNLQAAQDQAQAMYNRDIVKGNVQEAINKDFQDAQRSVAEAKYSTAIGQGNDAVDAKTAAIEGMFGSALGALQFAKSDFDPATGKYLYGRNRQGTQQSAPSANPNPNIAWGNQGTQVMGANGQPITSDQSGMNYIWG